MPTRRTTAPKHRAMIRVNRNVKRIRRPVSLLGASLRSARRRLAVPGSLGLDYLRAWWETRDQPGSPMSKAATALRLFGPWMRSLQPPSTALVDRVPWITFMAREFLDSALSSQDTVVEYGSGGSTLYYALRCRTVVSVEHDPDWFDRVQSALAALGVRNCRAR